MLQPIIEFYSTSVWIWLGMALCLGTFANVVIYRVPLILQRQWAIDAGEDPAKYPRMTLSTPHSSCRSCGARVRWYQNIPVLSYVFLRGKCGHCGAGISLRYPLVELSFLGIGAASIHFWGLSLQALAYGSFASILLVLSLIDWDHMLLPDVIVYPLLWAGPLAASVGLNGLSVEDSVYGAVGGWLFLFVISWVYERFRGIEGMGAGDFKLLAACCAWLGLGALPLIMLVASVAVVASMAVLRLKQSPFGPFISLGAVTYLVLNHGFSLSILG